MRERFCRICRGWHNVEAWPSDCYKPRSEARSSLAVPYFICDSMDETQSMLDGKYYTSKSELRATYKAAGMIELGNEEMAPFKAPEKDRKGQRDAIERAICEVEAGNVRPALTELPTF